MDLLALTFLERLHYNTGVKNPLIETSGQLTISLFISIEAGVYLLVRRDRSVNEA